MRGLLLSAGLSLLLPLTLIPTRASMAAETGLFEPGAVPGTVRLAGSRTSIGAGGRFEGHAAWSDREFAAGHKGRDILYFPNIPVADSSREGSQFRSQARQSRLWLRALHPLGDNDSADADEFEAYVEWDMEETPDSYKLRLRHAFVNLGPVLAGRSYTTFINTAALPEIDSGVAPGEVVTKRAQLRWTGALTDNTELRLALEEPDSRIAPMGGSVGFRSFDDDHVPNLVGRFTRYTEHGEYSLATMLRSLRWQGEGVRQKKLVGGLGFSGRFNFAGGDNLRLMLNYGNGLGRYVTLGSYADGYYDETSGDLHGNTVASIQVAYQHFWQQSWRSTISLGHSRASLPATVHPELIEQTRSLQTNLLFSPVEDLSLGIEFLHGRKRLISGASGRLNRLLFVARYEFGL